MPEIFFLSPDSRVVDAPANRLSISSFQRTKNHLRLAHAHLSEDELEDAIVFPETPQTPATEFPETPQNPAIGFPETPQKPVEPTLDQSFTDDFVDSDDIF